LIDMGSLNWKGAMDQTLYVTKMMNIYKENKLKHIFITHPDTDHLNYGLDPMCKQGLLFEIVQVNRIGNVPPITDRVMIHISSKKSWEFFQKEFFINFVMQYSDHFKLIYHWIDTNPGVVQHPFTDICKYPTEGNAILETKTKIEIITAEIGSTSNSRSMVMMLRNGNNENNKEQKMLFMGDFEGESNYNELVHTNGARLAANILMIPHHGAAPFEVIDVNSYGRFYDAVNAEEAVISSNILDSNRHPAMFVIWAFCGILSDVCDVVCDTCDNGEYEIMGYQQMIKGGHNIGKTLNARKKCNENKHIHQTTWIDPKTYLMWSGEIENILYSHGNPITCTRMQIDV